MTNKFEYNQIIKIIPNEVENACSAKIMFAGDNNLDVELIKTNKKPSGLCEIFSVTEAGIIYFKAEVEPIGETNICKIKLPGFYNIMQRREYTRIPFNATTQFKCNNTEIPVMVTDISAGGMRVVSADELSMSQVYSFQLHLSKQYTIDTIFTPIRQEKNEQNTFIISGKFKNLTNKERITLVQYCFTKQMENTNK